VIDVVAAIDLAAFSAPYRADGHGRAAHDPAMMVALLLYVYAIGERHEAALASLFGEVLALCAEAGDGPGRRGCDRRHAHSSRSALSGAGAGDAPPRCRTAQRGVAAEPATTSA
jgi:hypothetical protein